MNNFISDRLGNDAVSAKLSEGSKRYNKDIGNTKKSLMAVLGLQTCSVLSTILTATDNSPLDFEDNNTLVFALFLGQGLAFMLTGGLGLKMDSQKHEFQLTRDEALLTISDKTASHSGKQTFFNEGHHISPGQVGAAQPPPRAMYPYDRGHSINCQT